MRRHANEEMIQHGGGIERWKSSNGHAFAMDADGEPALARRGVAGRCTLLLWLVLQVQPVTTDAAGVVVKGNVPVLAGKAIREQVLSNPALDALACSVNGGVLQSTSSVTGPVVCCLGRQEDVLGLFLACLRDFGKFRSLKRVVGRWKGGIDSPRLVRDGCLSGCGSTHRWTDAGSQRLS